MQDEAYADAEYVLKNIDGANTKALYRRAHYYRTKNQLAKAETDLELILKLDKKSNAVKDLKEVRQMIVEEKKSKIKEVAMASQEEAAPEEESEQKDAEPKKHYKIKTPNLDEEAVAKAAEKAAAAAVK